MSISQAQVSALRLQKILLSWDYWDLEICSEAGSGAVKELHRVPKTFNSVQEYISVFEPLVLEECGALLLRGNEEASNANPHQAVVAVTSMVCFFRKIYLLLSDTATANHESDLQQDDFLVVRLVLEEGISQEFSDNDMILLSKDDPNDGDARQELHALGFVDGHEGLQSLSVKFYLQLGPQKGSDMGTKRVRAMLAGLLQPDSAWYMLKLSSMSTILREWNALHCVHDLKFKQVLLSGSASVASQRNPLQIPQEIQGKVEREYNASQVSAVTQGLDGTPVILIQGPPGTGKTKTILALLSVIMHSAPPGSGRLLKCRTEPKAKSQVSDQEQVDLWQQSSPWLNGANCREAVKPWDPPSPIPSWVDTFGLLKVDSPTRVGRGVGRKSHVLVCAPSNSALDEIVIRLLSTGLLDEHGDKHTPSIIRMGMNVHHSVESVSMEMLVKRRMEASKDSRVGRPPSRIERDRTKLRLLEEAHIVCSTLSFSGSSIFLQMAHKFDVVVIDEAAQAVEPATLVPLVQGVKQVFLVGDPIQLPATVISKRAVAYGYDVSLFKRLQTAGYPVHVLDTQYRMHPDICRFPSNQFYGGGVKTGEGVEEATRRPWHAKKAFGPFVFYDTDSKETSPEGSSSLVNVTEVEMVLCVYAQLMSYHPELKSQGLVAVISPYKAQVKLIRDKFKAALGDDARLVDVNTIDGFQGREKDVAIFSTVRDGKKHGSIGFVGDERRINVGLTRARSSLIVIGNAKALKADDCWGNLVKQAMVGGNLYRPQKPFKDYIERITQGKVQPVKPSTRDLQEQTLATPVASAVASDVEYANSDTNGPPDPAALAAVVNCKSGKQQRRGAAVVPRSKKIKKG